MKLEINKEWVDEAVQKAVDEIKQNFVPLSVIEDIKHEIRKYLEDVCIYENEAEGIMFCLDVMDKHIVKDKDISIDKNGNVWVKQRKENRNDN